ncbi:pilus assembly protein TadG-related protein [Sphingomonas flavescens]|jgi:Flp pilus assembly protein TadG|uniref:pilus assembly protein TadG-related protein n=1 Tax=Sphingomonas flavescens TaxID=3132797 RepID=UPI0028037F2C|nr:pilus assembly protein TadG-related protein [Sphingomonas limnosediminicola]
MIAFIRKILKDRRGNALAIACAAMPLIVGASGLAVDTIQWTLWKRQLQRAADSAAIAGVYDREAASGSTSTIMTTVNHDLTLNKHTWMALKTGYPTLEYPANSGVMMNQVKVTLAIQQPLPFSSFFMTTAPTIFAVSTAASIPAGGDPCMGAFETSAKKTGLNFTGNAGIEAPDCTGWANSASTNSAAAGGSSNVTLETVVAVGGIQESNNWHVKAYRPYSPPFKDPYADVNPDPSDMRCTTADLTQDTNLAAAASANTNCWASLRVNSGTTLNLDGYVNPNNPNKTFYINAGDAFVQGNITCTACTIVLTNKDPLSTTIGQFKVNAGSNTNLTAPTAGTYKGIAIYQDRRAQDSNQTNKINGNSGSIIQGALYFPSQQLDYNGTGTTSAICTMFLSRRLNFSGNSTTTNKFRKLADCAAFGLGAGSGTSRMVRLVA